ncbi:hypothetical protein SAMN05660405_00203 [Psychrobacter pacificensis]|uniref:Uncharacterized protein n=1 Tax=Psychrobacter pacificensis TaxID=112002 RepID=A0A1G6UFS2_9GAMM|nr:hypothetical protein SAMN05660405_00203 [Psychrobacter pacificensis]
MGNTSPLAKSVFNYSLNTSLPPKNPPLIIKPNKVNKTDSDRAYRCL